MAETDSRMDTLYGQQMPPGTVYLGNSIYIIPLRYIVDDF